MPICSLLSFYALTLALEPCAASEVFLKAFLPSWGGFLSLLCKSCPPICVHRCGGMKSSCYVRSGFIHVSACERDRYAEIWYSPRATGTQYQQQWHEPTNFHGILLNVRCEFRGAVVAGKQKGWERKKEICDTRKCWCLTELRTLGARHVFKVLLRASSSLLLGIYSLDWTSVSFIKDLDCCLYLDSAEVASQGVPIIMRLDYCRCDKWGSLCKPRFTLGGDMLIGFLVE